MPVRRTTFAVLAAAAIALTGCAAAPQPVITVGTIEPATPEEQAFAAAEETYRTYIDAINRVDLSDPTTFDDVYAWSTGDALEGERRSLTDMHARAMTVRGTTVIQSIKRAEHDSRTGVTWLRVCSDVSEIELLYPDGASAVSPDRSDRYALDVSLEKSDTATGMAVASSRAVKDPTCTP